MKPSTATALASLSLCCAAVVAHAAEKVRAVNEGGIRDQWMLADGVKLAAPAYPVLFAKGKPRDVCLALGYQINPDGSTSKFQVLRQWNSDTAAKEPVDGFWAEFAQSGAQAVSQWRFKPRPEITAPAPVFTVATLTWQTQQGSDAMALRGHCHVDDVAALLQEAKRREDLNDKSIDSDNRARDREMQRQAGTPRTL